jgi:hypothetical protein
LPDYRRQMNKLESESVSKPGIDGDIEVRCDAVGDERAANDVKGQPGFGETV